MDVSHKIVEIIRYGQMILFSDIIPGAEVEYGGVFCCEDRKKIVQNIEQRNNPSKDTVNLGSLGSVKFEELLFLMLNEKDDLARNLASYHLRADNLIYNYLREKFHSDISSLDKITITLEELLKIKPSPIKYNWKGRVYFYSDQLETTLALLLSLRHMQMRVYYPEKNEYKQVYPIPQIIKLKLHFFESS